MALDPMEAAAIIARYPSPRSAIGPLLWLGQNADGWVRPETVAEVAALVGVSNAEVYSFLGFYTMFRRQKPCQRRLQVCRSLACAMRGAEEILEHIQAETGVGPGQADPAGGFSVEVVECIAACDHAPAYLYNEHMDGPLTADRAMQLLRPEGDAQ